MWVEIHEEAKGMLVCKCLLVELGGLQDRVLLQKVYNAIRLTDLMTKEKEGSLQICKRDV
jgi:hypothetical protein